MMRRQENFVGLLLIVIVSIIYFLGVPDVPFHPDESSYIFMSSDIDKIQLGVERLFWTPENENNSQQKYRALDAPLTRYFIGVGRQIFGLPGLNNDWDWTKSWEDNELGGAVPSDDLLTLARVSTAFLYPFSMVLFYFAAMKAKNPKTALMALLLFSINPLLLLHTRRAMEESLLIFTCVCFVFIIVYSNNPWWIGIITSLAFSAKHTGGLLLIVGLVAVIWAKGVRIGKRRTIINIGILALVFLTLSIFFNPFLWKHPIASFISAVEARHKLSSQQIEFIGMQNPNMILDTPVKRFAGLAGSLFFTPPIIAEAGNYLQQTSLREQHYFANPIHHIYSGFYPGVIFMVLDLVGFLFGAIEFFKRRMPWNRPLGLFLFASILIFVFLLLFIPLPFQRYYLLLIPFNCFWAAYGINELFEKILNDFRRINAINPA